MRKILKSFMLLVLSLTVLLTIPNYVFAMETNILSNTNEESTSGYYNNDAEYIGSYDLGNGFTCDVYEIVGITTYASGSSSKIHDFSLYCNGTYFGTLRQETSWSYDGTNRPTLDSHSNVFYSTNTNVNYLRGVSQTTSNEGTSAKKYNVKAEVYYNNSYISTTNFASICDKNGTISCTCVDD